MNAIVASPCCCNPTGDCTFESFPSSFLLDSLDGSYLFERYGNSVSCPRPNYTGTTNCEYRFSLTYTLPSPVTMVKTGPSCYRGAGLIDVSGTVDFTETGERRDCAGGGGTIICTNSGSFNFSTTTEFCLEVTCGPFSDQACGKTFTPPALQHQLMICDFPVVNRHSFLTGDEETCDCVLGPETGFICLGAAIRWSSMFKQLNDLVLTDYGLHEPGWSMQRCGAFIGPNPVPTEPEYPCAYYVGQNTIHGPFPLHSNYDWDWGAEDEPVGCTNTDLPADVAFSHKPTGWDNACWAVDLSVPCFDYIVAQGFIPPVYA